MRVFPVRLTPTSMEEALEEYVSKKRPRLQAEALAADHGPSSADLKRRRVALGPLGRRLIEQWCWGHTPSFQQSRAKAAMS